MPQHLARVAQDDLARLEHIAPAGDLERHVGVLLDEQNGRPLAVYLYDPIKDVLHQDGRQSHRRLVHQQQPWAGHHSAAGSQHLLLTATQSSPHLAPALLEAREERKDVLQILGNGRAVVTGVGAHIQILGDGQLGKNSAPFGYHGHALVDDLVGLVGGHILIFEKDLALARLEQPADGAQRRRLASAVSADQCHDLAFLDGERDSLQGVDVAIVGVYVINF